ncbi:hypothetical protein L596_003986 [Steinernema carpocapsae]|uniref:C-type lectin domain-containing protein n=1 Tax=Steinernema carpocapsae TaxID=34508 RepID=A0A4U8UVD2_STECR|nr:hypothetical protein L596_003986 [Steinernema carpocapsae]
MNLLFAVIPLLLSMLQGSQALCPCAGVQISVGGQLHCFEILDPTGNSWVDADQTCARRGGFMAHVNSSEMYGKLFELVKKNYKKPVLTGMTVGNHELKLLALMCPKNSFNSFMDVSVVDSLIPKDYPDAKRRCVYFKGANYTLQYERCDHEAQVLCNFPMEKPNYCNSLMNCTSTTTSAVSTTTSLSSTSAYKTNLTSTVTTSTTSSPKPSTVKNPPIVIPPAASTQQPDTPAKPPKSIVIRFGKKPTIAKRETTTAAQVKPKFTTPSSSINRDCGGGYTAFGRWCVPWWVWLLLGILLLLLLCCCLGWLLHICCACCLCCIPQQVVEKERQGPYGVDKQVQTANVQTQETATSPVVVPPVSVPPSPPTVASTVMPDMPPVVAAPVVEKNEIIFAPVPHAPMSNPGMLVPPTEAEPDGLSNCGEWLRRFCT